MSERTPIPQATSKPEISESAQALIDAANARADVAAKLNGQESFEADTRADVAIYGTNGETTGYVDLDGKPLTEPIPGKINDILDEPGVADRRVNPKYGKTQAERDAAADAYEIEQAAEAEDYGSRLEALREEGFELSQAKLLLDLEDQRRSREQDLIDTLESQNPGKTTEENLKRVAEKTAKDGYDPDFEKEIIRKEGILDQKGYDKFRYKHGRKVEGERDEFKAALDEFNTGRRAKADADARTEIQDRMDKKDRQHQNQRLGEAWTEATDARAEADYNATWLQALQENEAWDAANRQPQGLRARVRGMMQRAAARWNTMSTSEKRTAGVLAGVVAVAAAYGAYKVGANVISHDSAHQHAHDAANAGAGHAADHAGNAGDMAGHAGNHAGNAGDVANHGGGAHQQAQEIAGHMSEKSVTLQEGQNPWTVAQHHLQMNGIDNPTDEQIWALDQRILDANGLSLEDAKHLQIGTTLKIPEFTIK